MAGQPAVVRALLYLPEPVFSCLRVGRRNAKPRELAVLTVFAVEGGKDKSKPNAVLGSAAGGLLIILTGAFFYE